MEPRLVWQDRVPEQDGKPVAVNDSAFTADGERVIFAVGDCVLVYNAADGDLLQPLQAHKDVVYSVSTSADGLRFASGGADETVILWILKGESYAGELKYKHQDAVQSVSYNPVSSQLLSCTASDFGLWHPEQRSVDKHRVDSKILSCSWTPNGLHFALGFFSGRIQIRDRDGTARASVDRGAPVWALAWRPSGDGRDVLAAGCWDQSLSFHTLGGQPQGAKDQRLPCDPTSLSWLGPYLVVGGADRRATLCTREGAPLLAIAERDGWVWTVASRPPPSRSGAAAAAWRSTSCRCRAASASGASASRSGRASRTWSCTTSAASSGRACAAAAT